ncbi:MAG: Plug and carboxypeptidase regulatory-like domain-containing protein [Acidobacteriota bacterium]|nr:Plug and carboxypeptidase regulatory-like domain-containing protein [Acidobacteriota bacterium]
MARLRLFASLLVFSAAAAAQTGVIQGTLEDATGAALANAKVTAIDEGKKLIARETKSGPDGTFRLLDLLRGNYTVRAEAAGFKTLERTGLTLDPNQVMALGQLRLEIGQLTEQVTVESQMPLVETSTADRGFVISSKQVVELALNGRDFQSLLRTLPGVVSNDASDFRLAFNNTDSFNTNGLRGSMNNVFLDGSINTDVGANDGQYTQVSLDAVGEFKVETSNFAAEYGRNPGVLISISTKSGTSKFHGTAYEFLRNDDLDARSYFTNLQGATTPKLRFNQFGGNVGGWVYIPKVSTPKNKKLFFFVNYEGTRASRPNGGTFVDTFNPDLLNGDFRRSFRFNADGSPVLIKNSTFPVGTVFMPGTVTRDNANNIIGGTPFPNNTVPQSLWAKNTPAFLKVNQRDQPAARHTDSGIAGRGANSVSGYLQLR